MAPQADRPDPLELFYSYSHRDEGLRDELETHLAMLKNEGIIQGWHDRRINAGQEWDGEIDEHLNSARVILLLASPNFLASRYCYDIEVKRAMERHEAGEARVIPVILRPSEWERAPFSKLQALPTGAVPITRWPDRDEAFLNVAQGIRLAVEGLTRSMAAARLSQDPRAPNFHRHFVAYFLLYAEERRAPTPENYDAMEAEKDNLLGASEVAFASGDRESVMRMAYVMAVPVTGMLSMRGYWDETVRLGEQALQAARSSQD